jgi:hypothetical protein
MMIRIFVLVLCFSSLASAPLFADPLVADRLVVRVPKPQPDSEVAQSYFLQLLRMALLSGSEGRPLPEVRETTVMEQERATLELRRNKLIDVYWMGTSAAREQHLNVIPIPLDRGLLGFRQLIIQRDKLSLFNDIETAEDLKKLIACQGLGWPDVEILRASHFRVTVSSGFEGLYKQLAAGRCDYLPRGLFEAAPELEQRKLRYRGLQIYDKVLIHYPFAVYFFVSPDNEYLAQWITKGLENMISNGQFQQFMETHLLMIHLFPLQEKVSPKFIFDIPNPLLPEATDYKNSRYWIQREEILESYD